MHRERLLKFRGISKQEGVKNVFVRGLGDRYNLTTLNRFPIPSEDPEYKNIALDFFSTDIIQSVDVNKTFGGTMASDVAGAGINISSKELVGRSELSFGVCRSKHQCNAFGRNADGWSQCVWLCTEQ